MQIRRKLYTRGSSYETTIPMPLLFSVDKSKKHEVIFKFDQKSNRWYIDIEEASEDINEIEEKKKGKNTKKKNTKNTK